MEILKSREFRNSMFYIYLVSSLTMIAVFLPVRWRSDLKAMDFALTTNAEGYVVIRREIPFIPPDSYVLPEDMRGIDLEELGKELDDREAYLGYMEFYKDAGEVMKLIRTRKHKEKMFRVHTLQRGEFEKLRLDFDSVYMRLRRAVLERSIDLIWLKNLPEGYVPKLEKKLKNEFKGHVVERPSPHPPLPITTWPFAIAILFLLASYKPILALVAGVIMLSNYDLGISAGSILSTLALYSRFKDPYSLFANFLLLGIITNASLSDFDHLNQIEIFRGVKISLVMLPALIFMRGFLENLSVVKNKKILYLSGIAFALIGVYYVMRSGNFAPVALFERKMRDLLEKIFWIRPRFKEIFGYPLLFAFRELEWTDWSFIIEALGSIALVSTFNTFCHVKTPIFVSIYRSALGFGLGFIIFKLFQLALVRRGGEKRWSGSPWRR